MIRDIDILDVGLDFGNCIIPAGRLTLTDSNVGAFEHNPDFAKSTLRVSPHF